MATTDPTPSAAPAARRIVADVDTHPDGRPRGFHLQLGNERTTLEPGKSWIQLDHFKWVTRGVIEPPQSFAVHPDGSVDLNGETFHPDAPDSAALFTEQINKRHATAAAKPKPAAQRAAAAAPTSGSERVHFKVRLDAVGHLLVEARRGADRVETGLRGLAHLADDGWIVRPKQIHIDPLQRYLEIDGHRLECNAEGAAAFETLLNQHYVPAASAHKDVAIEIRENLAASSGFDIHFWTVRAGARFENKGHLSQDKLDILQDRDKCDLLQPGIILRLSPPFLYIRRRRPDGGEEHLPGLPDIKYRGISATELQRLLNHPSIRAGGSANAATEPAPAEVGYVATAPTQPIEANATHAAPNTPAAAGSTSPLDAPAPASPPRTPPQPPILATDATVPHPGPATPTPATTPSPTPPPLASEIAGTASKPAFTPPPKAPPPAAAPKPAEPSEPTLDPTVAALFAEADPHRINEAVFRSLADRMQFPVQDVLLSLPRIFDDRRFEILDFNGEEIVSVLQLRSGHFYGFYLTHIGPERIDLVYACHGTHIEWGTDKCAFQPTSGAETLELRGTGLLGLAQNAENHFVFVVEPRYFDWIKPHATVCAEAFAHFVTVEQWARKRSELPLIWPA